MATETGIPSNNTALNCLKKLKFFNFKIKQIAPTFSRKV